MVVSNALQPGQRIDRDTYRQRLKKLGDEAGLAGNLSEHSSRRRGARYHYFVLRWDIVAMYRCFKWDRFNEIVQYIGVEDKSNSNALAGFTAMSTTELRYGA